MSGLVSPDWLEARLGDPSLVILEVSFYLPDRAAWFTGHIPGSRYVWWKHLCWHPTERRFPEPGDMAARLAALGVGDDHTLVLVGDRFQFATYAYWVITMAGLEDRAVVLDGGHRTWEEQGRPMNEETPDDPVPAALTPGQGDSSLLVGRDDVLAHLHDPRRLLVDLRSDEEFSGDRVAPASAPFDHGAERGGHIPGAQHLHYERLLRPDGTLKSAEACAEEFASAGLRPGQEVVTYCRLSHRASLGWFVLTRILGGQQARVYDGSWTEWGSMVGMPVER